MKYILKQELFETYFVNSSGSFKHNQGKNFMLFPFITSPNGEVRELDRMIGRALCRIEKKYPKEIMIDDMLATLIEKTEIMPGYEGEFNELIQQLFFDENGKMRPLNLRMMEQRVCEKTNEEKIADYLADVLGEKEELRKYITEANKRLLHRANVLERVIFEQLEVLEEKENNEAEYFRVVRSLCKKFEDDFAYIVASSNRVREYLIPLFELYYFTYTAQTCLQLDRFFDGDRDSIIPLYFSLDWEGTSLNRRCYTEGWQKLQMAIKKIFAHAVTLEILNSTEPDNERVDYISLFDIIRDNKEKEIEILNVVKILIDKYRGYVTDCDEMNQLSRDSDDNSLEQEIRFLFKCIKTRFEYKRPEPYNRYSKKFEIFCYKFLKNRGGGRMTLNLTEENIIFLTKIAIKDNEKRRLVDIFKEFENRGIYLDNLSKDQVAKFYEKRNLIEKKSDSGDAKYVKRIL